MGAPVKKDPRGKGRGQLWFYWIVGAGLWIWTGAALLSGTTGVGPLISYFFKEREAAQALVRINGRVQVLESRATSLRSDPFAMERQAREREHRLRPGEILVLPRGESR
ncbi:MAG: septum formation initiator family protein [Nitrospirae bacterium]|nr:septum formation initiator family protein [Nitrospirota bacterium]MCL5285521.1 septum formation initiator family protein [Nitrospirota bacterium]